MDSENTFKKAKTILYNNDFLCVCPYCNEVNAHSYKYPSGSVGETRLCSNCHKYYHPEDDGYQN